MDPSDFSSEKFPRKELQGPRPTPLKIHRDSHKIRKPPMAPQPSHAPSQPPRQPVIIYDISPKIIHISPSNFMDLVQRLTGLPPSSAEVGAATNSTSTAATNSTSTAATAYNVGSGAISPAARYAAIEKARSPQGMKSVIKTEGNLDFLEHHVSAFEGMEMNNKEFFSGILSPGPASLPPIPQSFFSPISDGFFHDLSPHVFHGNKNFIEGSFMASPAASYFLSPRITSPSTPSIDLLFSNIFKDNNF